MDVELAWDNEGDLAKVTLTNVASFLGARDVILNLLDGRALKADLAVLREWLTA